MIGADDILVNYILKREYAQFQHHEFYNTNVDLLPIFGGLVQLNLRELFFVIPN